MSEISEPVKLSEPNAVIRMIREVSGSISLLAIMGSVVAHASVGALFLIQRPKVTHMAESIVAEIVFESEGPATAATPATSTHDTVLEPPTEPVPDPPSQMAKSRDLGDIDAAADALPARVADPAPIFDQAPDPPTLALEIVEDIEIGSYTLGAAVADLAPTQKPQPEAKVEIVIDQPERSSGAVEIRENFSLAPPKPPIPKKRISEEPTDPENTVYRDIVPAEISGPKENEPSEEPPIVQSEIASLNALSSERQPGEFTEQTKVTTLRAMPRYGKEGVAPASGNPKPRYPSRALARGIQGRVVLSVEVTRSGSVGAVAVVEASGHRILDAAAIRAVRRWRFLPARQFGVPINGSVTIPIIFRLSE